MQDSFGIYIHWPFCAAKCPYCDFNSHIRHQPVDQSVFVQAYERELEYFAAQTNRKKITSIFFGGGTPSLMDVKTVEKLLNCVARHWPIDSNVEITLEANPSSVEAERFRGYRNAGVNRVSLGVQSLDDRQLKFLGRLHNVAEAKSAITLAREIFPRMSFDLIYARPNQTPHEWEQELRAALDLAADHLSLYQLTIEQGTRFYELRKKGKLHVPGGELSAQLYETTQMVMNAHNMPAYEISNHAVQGAESHHNLTYWRYHDYVGVGPGAHGRISNGKVKKATACQTNPEIWWQNAMANSHGLITNEDLDTQEMADEFLVMGLRLAEGISLDRYNSFGASSLNQSNIAFLQDKGFIEFTKHNNLRVTAQGFLVLDAVVADLAAEQR